MLHITHPYFPHITVLPASTYAPYSTIGNYTGGLSIQIAYKNRSLIKSGLEDADDTTS